LAREMRAGRTCHGLKEAPVEFPPTYKYSIEARKAVGNGQVKLEEMDEEGQTWAWAEHRWPSWCDRVLYLDTPQWMEDAKVQVLGYKALPLMASSDHRPVACYLSIPAKAIPEPSAKEREGGGVRCEPPFALDPYWRQRRKVARVFEVVVGIGAYATMTWEGCWILPLLFLLVVVLWFGVFM
ncbi:MAG: hypothetical protein Q9164_005572, partial [Protoblastenia rupestris]